MNLNQPDSSERGLLMSPRHWDALLIAAQAGVESLEGMLAPEQEQDMQEAISHLKAVLAV